MDPAHFAIHALFDVAAWAAAAMALRVTRRAEISFPVAPHQRRSYYAALIFGSAMGAYLFGTLNMIACGQPGVARSIEGAIFGGVFGIELYKRLAGVIGRTGARFAAPLAIGIVVGRIGCFYAGIDDFTYGTPTHLSWGHDFGDGIMRHPAPLYESAAMALFLIVYLVAVFQRNRFTIDNGLYLAIGWYAIQRFIFEYFKPYAAIAGSLTIFQCLSVVLLIYSVFMLLTARLAAHERALPA
jgi:prolipoprotein diacylglyceryltransferase